MNFFEVYAKHAALNFGQAVQGLRHLHSHPDMDAVAPRGSAKHLLGSVAIRTKRVAGDLFFAALPPHTHHSAEELAMLRPIKMARWFQYGACAWRFTETGEPKTDLTGVDRRWDPRCR